jgi:hypothetical protein
MFAQAARIMQASLRQAHLFPDQLVSPLQAGLRRVAGMGLSQLPVLALQRIPDAQEGQERLGIIQAGGQPQRRVHLLLQALQQGRRRGGPVLGQAANFLQPAACIFQVEVDPGLDVPGQPQADLFAQGFDAVQALAGQAVLGGSQRRPGAPQDQGQDDED